MKDKILEKIINKAKKTQLDINRYTLLNTVFIKYDYPLSCAMALTLLKQFELEDKENKSYEPILEHGEMIVPKQNFNKATSRTTD